MVLFVDMGPLLGFPFFDNFGFMEGVVWLFLSNSSPVEDKGPPMDGVVRERGEVRVSPLFLGSTRSGMWSNLWEATDEDEDDDEAAAAVPELLLVLLVCVEESDTEEGGDDDEEEGNERCERIFFPNAASTTSHPPQEASTH